VDAALLQAVTLRLLPAEDLRLHATVNAVQHDLAHEGWLKRYRTNDGFGVPAVAFMLCTFWQVEALARLGRAEEARALMDRVRDVKSPLGLLAEDLEPVSNAMWGNFPQAYSHVGLIHAAFAASPRWSEYGS
jgi:GH15 family glucan-1,4-alpha-glucosidase